METIKLSSKGQVVLPKAIRLARNLTTGTEFLVEDTPAGILLRPLKPFGATSADEVFACLRYKGKEKSVDAMDQAVLAAAKRRRSFPSPRRSLFGKWYQDGMDFADAMHLAFSEEAESFATFDEKLVRRARQIEAISVRVP